MDDLTAWQDLLELDAAAPLPQPEPSGPGPSIDELLRREDLPEELKALLRQGRELEGELRALTGQRRPEDEEGNDAERLRKMYPVFAHTKESRLQEKRLRARDEMRARAQKRRLEQGILTRKRIRAEEEARAAQRECRRRAAVARQQAELAAREKQAAEAERRQLDLSRQRRDEENRAIALRRRQERELLLARWQEERDESLRRLNRERSQLRYREEAERNEYLERRRQAAQEARLAMIMAERREAKRLEERRLRKSSD